MMVAHGNAGDDRLIQFIKMHGAGNDYVYLDAIANPALAVRDDLDRLATQMSDRHKGIGSDGLIVVMRPDPGIAADVRMRMFNADGSESEMCGNGVRCVAKLAVDAGHTSSKPLLVQTGRGVLEIDYNRDADGRVPIATVDMGRPILTPSEIPVSLPGHARIVDHPAADLLDLALPSEPDWQDRAGLDPRFTCVSMGNPHVVLYVHDVQAVPLERVGPAIEHAAIFPRRVNVHFVQVHASDELTMRTWERGSGITQACGTGASAVCVAGVLTGRSGRSVHAHLPGGDLSLEWPTDDAGVLMTGEAIEVFRGVWPA